MWNGTAVSLLREMRNKKLRKTDWLAASDNTLSSAWETYRQKLRDLPAAASPKLDSDGGLTNVTWPDVPE